MIKCRLSAIFIIETTPTTTEKDLVSSQGVCDKENYFSTHITHTAVLIKTYVGLNTSFHRF